ncbi:MULTISPECIES: AGE family epimerase/isomerase [unclassified Brevundimonas]|uniref:AGE family epimerase/isomerase n=1 Tax=unclassified Brevundimonas TaxID=2622653 RepID=UPI0025C4D704|nr:MULTISPECIES: AGE family epimerase/isomerase [unclassified Brevundimonas]
MTSGAVVRFKTELDTTRQWLFDCAYSLWSTVGTDDRKGGFFERIHADGTLCDDPRRSRLVARQIYVFAMAKQLGWSGPCDALIEHGLNFLLNRSIQPDGRLVASVTAEGNVIDASFTLYDYAFAMFALAAASSAMPHRAGALETRANALLDILDQDHRTADGRGYQDDATILKSNPHMHLLEAAIAWTKVSDAPRWAQMANRLSDLCVSQFIDPRCHAVREYFARDWTPLDSLEHQGIEPGHQFEWAWLLMDWAERGNRPELVAPAQAIFNTGEQHGVSDQDLAVNTLSPDHSVLDPRHRLWPQTERLKAKTSLFRLAEAHNRDKRLDEVSAALASMRRFFDHPVRGAWWEHLEPDGRPAIEPSRASSLYHITCAVVEANGLTGVAEAHSRATAEACAS